MGWLLEHFHTDSLFWLLSFPTNVENSHNICIKKITKNNQYYIIQHVSCCALPARKQKEFQSQTVVISISQVPKGFLVAQLVKNLPVMQETTCNEGDQGSTPGSGRSPGEGNGHPLQYPCLGNPMDRGAWWATLHGDARVGHDLARLSGLNSKFISHTFGGQEV